LPALFDTAQLSSLTDVDYVKFTVAAGDVGKHIRAVTLPGDAHADTVLQFFGPTNPATAFGNPSDDNFYHEDWTSPAIVTAGTYYVKVSNSAFSQSFSATASHYSMAVLIQ
ncbi:MAG: uncharacterized protein JWO36_3950, partial [Myxococcales bacterium]|nr:uncharacterized protein [Myxococcales bacterium]